MEHHDQAQHHQGAPESPAGVGGAGRARSLAGARRDRASLSHRQEPLPPQEAALSRPQEEHRTAPHTVRPGQSGDRQAGAPSPVIGLITPAVCLDPAKAQKNLIRTPNSLQNHEQRSASAGKLCLGRYPTSHTRLLQRIPKSRAEAQAIMRSLGYGPNNRISIKIMTRNLPDFRDPASIV